MGNHAHDAGNLVGSCDASNFAFGTDRRGQVVLLRFEDSGLMQTDGRGMDAHICEDNVRIRQTSGKLELGRKTKGCVEENIVHLAVSFPERTIQVVVKVIGIRTVQMYQISAKQAGHEHDTSKRRQLTCTHGASAF